MKDLPYTVQSDCWPGLSKLVEELGELSQVCGKLLATGGEAAHWDGSDLRVRFIEEAADVLAAVTFVRIYELSSAEYDLLFRRTRDKIVLFERWRREHRDGAT